MRLCAALVGLLFALSAPRANGQTVDHSTRPKLTDNNADGTPASRLGDAREATVAFQREGQGVESAVCIDPSGYFLGRLPAMWPGSKPRLWIIPNPAAPGRRRLDASLVNWDPLSGLALVKVDVQHPLKATQLAALNGPTGSVSATSLSYPNVKVAGSNEAMFKGLAVSHGKLTWQTLPSGQVIATLSDSDYHAGMVGGAVLSDDGKLIGILDGGAPPHGMRVVPAARLNAFMKAPILAFLPPEITAAEAHAPHRFSFRLIGPTPAGNVTATLTLSGGARDQRRFAAQPDRSGAYTAIAAPLPANVTSSRVHFTLEATCAGTALGRSEGDVTLSGADPRVVAADAAKSLSEGGEVHIKLPAPSDVVVPAGNGRYLLISCPEAKQLAIFDVTNASVRTLNIGADHFLFASDADKAIVCLPAQCLLQQWDLATGRRLRVRTAPAVDPIEMVMGPGSAGPLIFRSADRCTAVDPDTLNVLRLEGLETLASRAGPFTLKASADGKVLADEPTQEMVRVVRLAGGKATSDSTTPSLSRATDAAPDVDGGRIYTGAGPVVTPQLTAIPGTEPGHGYWIPSDDNPTFFISVAQPLGDGAKTATVLRTDAQGAIVSQSLPETAAPGRNGQWQGIDRRIHLFCAFGRLVTVPIDRSEVVVHAVELTSADSNRGTALPYVRSVPPRVARAGSAYRYAIQVAGTPASMPKFELTSGPAGMSISGTGELIWKVPPQARGTEESVIVTITPSNGTPLIQSFSVSVR